MRLSQRWYCFSCRFLGIGSVGNRQRVHDPGDLMFQLQVPWDRICWTVGRLRAISLLGFSCRFLGIGSVGRAAIPLDLLLYGFSCRFLGIGSVGAIRQRATVPQHGFSCRFLGIGSVGVRRSIQNLAGMGFSCRFLGIGSVGSRPMRMYVSGDVSVAGSLG